MFKNTKLYDELSILYAKAYPNKAKKTVQAEVNQLWHDLKKSKKGPVDDDKYTLEIDKLKSLVKKVEGSQKSIQSFLKRKDEGAIINNNVAHLETNDEGEVSQVEASNDEPGTLELVGEEQNNHQDKDNDYQTPKQEKLKAEILEKEAALGKLLDAKMLGLETETNEKISKRIASVKQEIESKKKELKRKQTN